MRFARDGGREKLDKPRFLTTPQSRYTRQPLTAAVPSVAPRHLPTLWGVTPDKGSKIYFLTHSAERILRSAFADLAVSCTVILFSNSFP